MKKDVQFKSFAFKAEDLQENGMIRGLASTFGNVDYGMDVVDKGAFKKSIKESKGLWPILADHDPSKQIGWNVRAEETDAGLLVEGQLDMNVQAAREKYSLAKTALEKGAKMGLSIGYNVIKWDIDRENLNVRHLKEVKLWEYSIVTFPMNDQAQITAAKSQAEKIDIWLKQTKEFGLTENEIKDALLKSDAGLLHELEAEELIKKLRETGLALKKAAPKIDPALISQSISNMIALFKKTKGD